ncbi:DUF4365 domain-containing protein [Mucilaginibacter sp. OK098]|uniref:DUF4365 domain-containing protein n=1 Tax=Mucilaginibacter sp. OK098 TaxID=1855297 RepID=UPI00091D5A66|nr:DUF4365 domain-containing protein [Mucilaginibacter sp. OK098]SHN26035.1 protein of unknown function [Mucilaginibacter sp. OK098]
MNFDDLVDKHLPKGSANKDLEKTSRIEFERILDPGKFQARPETDTDVGIDYIVELKNNNHYTNFRFAVQLKSTSSINASNDGSFRFPVEVSNVNYLISFNGHSYYVLFVAKESKFYYKNAHEVFIYLTETYPGGDWPNTVGVKFTDILDSDALDTLYQQIFTRSKTIRNVRHLLNVHFQNDRFSRVTIDENEKVTAESDIVAELERFGMRLINEYKYDEIIRQKGLVNYRIIDRALFQMVCGMAHYRKAEMHQAITCFKISLKFKEQLRDGLAEIARYHLEAAKYSLGINSREEYDAAMETMVNSSYIGLYVSIQKSFNELFDGHSLTQERVRGFYQKMNEIIAHPEADDNIGIHARAQILAMEAEVLNNALIRNLSVLRGTPWAADIVSRELAEWQKTADMYGPRAEELREFARGQGDFFAYNIITITVIKAYYSNLFTHEYIMNFDESAKVVNVIFTTEQIEKVIGYCTILDEVAAIYQTLDSTENLIVAHSLRYELLRLIGHDDQATEAGSTMETLIDTYDLKELRKKYEYLTNGGTRHEQFLNLLINTFQNEAEAKRELEKIIEELKSIDVTEKNFGPIPKANYQIDLFPIGYFTYPKEQFDLLMNIIDVVTDLRPHILRLSGKIIPILNLFHNPVTQEGRVDGNESANLESYRNILRVRREFKANKIVPFPARN